MTQWPIDILSAWGDRRLVVRKSDQAMFIAVADGDGFTLTALDGTAAGIAPKADVTNILTFYMGKNTPDRKDYIMENLVVPVED